MKRAGVSLAATLVFSWFVAAENTQGSSQAKAAPINEPDIAESVVPGDPVRGKATWNRVGCYTCHGYSAQGSEFTGPKLWGRGLTMPDYQAFVRTPARNMPPYSKRMLSDDELRDIVAYVDSLEHGS